MDRFRLHHIRKKYEHFDLKGIDFPVKAGYITGLIGPNGSGKTTTIRAILNLIHLNEGTIEYDGEAVKDNGYLQDVGTVLDYNYFSKDWTARDIERILRAGYTHWDSSRFFKFLLQEGIADDVKVKDLSRGMSTKMMFAAALSHGARTLILDEPTSGLDPGARDAFCDRLQAFMAEGEDRAVLFSTHITQDLEQIADYIAFIVEGRLIYYGTKDDFLDAYRIVKCSKDAMQKASVSILGKKVHSTHCELLVNSNNADAFEGVIEKPSIDRIMTFYHRGE